MSLRIKLPNPLPTPEEAKKIGKHRFSTSEIAGMLLEDIIGFEQKYQMASEAFFEKYPTHDVAPDDSDWFLWESALSTLNRMLKKNIITRKTLYAREATREVV